MNAILEIRGLKKRFGDKEVLKGIDLSIPAGSIYGFVGKNGAGKTTTMKAILGLIAADGGEIYVCGERVTYGDTPTNRFIGYLPDVPEFYGFMTAREYLTFCGEITGMEKSALNSRAEKLLGLVGLADEKHRIKGYSRGMKQRLGIAQALLGSPKLLICDEPTSALDPIGRREILDILRSVKDETTVIFSTHILSDVESICTDVAFIDGGIIRTQGSLDDIRARLSKGEYSLETDSAGAKALTEKFAAMRVISENALAFSETDIPLHEILGFVASEKIALTMLQRSEPSLETLFMEVAGK